MDLLPANIELSGLEVSLGNTMSREVILAVLPCTGSHIRPFHIIQVLSCPIVHRRTVQRLQDRHGADQLALQIL